MELLQSRRVVFLLPVLLIKMQMCNSNCLKGGIYVNSSVAKSDKGSNSSSTYKRIMKEKWLYIMLIPGIVYYLIFVYAPMWGVLFAFQDYSPALGMAGSEWVGFKHFIRFFNSKQFGQLFSNTLIIAVINLVFYFPAPIILALMLNEVKNTKFKRSVQSITYLPHFMSAVVVVSIFKMIFSSEDGIINSIILSFGGDKISFLTSTQWFRPLLLLQTVWKEVGWGTIIFLAALSGVDPSLYEAAVVDGAGHTKQLIHITLPAIMPTITILLILRMGSFLNTGFETILLMQNSMNRSVSEVFDTYVYRVGISDAQYSYSTAIGLFKSVIGLVLVYTSNWFAKKLGQEGIF